MEGLLSRLFQNDKIIRHQDLPTDEAGRKRFPTMDMWAGKLASGVDTSGVGTPIVFYQNQQALTGTLGAMPMTSKLVKLPTGLGGVYQVLSYDQKAPIPLNVSFSDGDNVYTLRYPLRTASGTELPAGGNNITYILQPQ
jgi:hypothetical protein